MLLLLDLAALSFPYFGNKDFCGVESYSDVEWNCKEKISFLDAAPIYHPDVTFTHPATVEEYSAGTWPGAPGANTCANTGEPYTKDVNTLCGVEMECGPGQAQGHFTQPLCAVRPGSPLP